MKLLSGLIGLKQAGKEPGAGQWKQCNDGPGVVNILVNSVPVDNVDI